MISTSVTRMEEDIGGTVHRGAGAGELAASTPPCATALITAATPPVAASGSTPATNRTTDSSARKSPGSRSLFARRGGGGGVGSGGAAKPKMQRVRSPPRVALLGKKASSPSRSRVGAASPTPHGFGKLVRASPVYQPAENMCYCR
eukprot:SAG11_NODE_641_length_8008_cov_2.916171_4_plen_146_part_00